MHPSYPSEGRTQHPSYAFAYTGFGVPLLLAWLGDVIGPVPALSLFTLVPAAIAAWLTVDLRRVVGAR